MSRLIAPLALLLACAPNKAVLHPVAQRATLSVCDAAACRDSVRLTYLGSGGFVLRAGDGALMTSPSFTHRGLPWAALPVVRFSSDTAIVDGQLSRFDTAGISAILVGHSHYDHLLDVPRVAHRLAGATIYGSATVKHLLHGDSALRGGRVVDVGAAVGSGVHPGRWTYVAGGRLRFMPVASTHAKNWWLFTLAPGRRHRDLDALPKTSWGWRMGQTYAWLIDVVGPDSTPVLRIFYQDAATDPVHAAPPALEGRDRRDVDVAILCAGNFGKVPDYPTATLAATHPRQVVVGHWESFFRRVSDSTRVIPRTNTTLLAARLDSAVTRARWATPEPMTALVIRY